MLAEMVDPIEKHNESSAFVEGRLARRSGVLFFENPYMYDELRAKEWSEGWLSESEKIRAQEN